MRLALLETAAAWIAGVGVCCASLWSPARAAPSPGPALAASLDTVLIPSGTKVRGDGELGKAEWSDADTFEIRIGPERVVPVLIKHDGKALYVAFSNLPIAKTEERYPELLIDAANDGGVRWGLDDLWLHASYSNCDSRGGFDAYGTAACGTNRYGWSANVFPLAAGIVEFRVSLDFIGFAAEAPATGRVFGLALEVTDGSGVRAFWPPGSDAHRPGTWARVRLAPVSSPRSRR